MTLTLTTCLIALCAGGIGTFIGGTASFVVFGFAGLFSAIGALCGADMTFFDNYVLNLVFLPSVMFNGAGLAAAWAAKHHDIKGYDIGRTLAFTNDAGVILVGMLGGLCGWIIINVMTMIGFPGDTGAITVLLVGLFGRVTLGKKPWYNRRGIIFLTQDNTNYWLFQVLFAVILSALTAFFVEQSGLVSIGFSVSAALLLFAFVDPRFPATHQITMVAGYAMVATHNVVWAILFGVLGSLLCDIFARVFNTDCGTHIDPPAVAILMCSLIIFNVF